MASLHKDPRGKSPYWYCAYTLPTGKRAFKSTKQRDRQKAQQVCSTLHRASKLGAGGNLTEARARELISEIVENALGEPLKFYSTEEWLRDWLQGKKAAKATGTFLKYRRTIESFLAFLGTKAKRNLSQVTPRDIQRFRDAELAVGKHPTTCNSVVKHLRIPFTSARRQGLITHNPAEGVEMLNVKGQGSKGTFNHEQVKALVGAAHGDWRGAILTAYYTGARLQDVANLRWDSVDREKGLISFVARKTDQQLRIPIHPELQEYLLNLAVVDGSFVFPTLKGTGSGGKSGLSMAFSRIMGRANVRGEVAREAHGKGRRINTLSFHSLRHSFNSALANAGVPQEIRQTLTGHTSAEMNRRYTHHDLAPLRAAIAVLPCLDAPLGS